MLSRARQNKDKKAVGGYEEVKDVIFDLYELINEIVFRIDEAINILLDR